MHLAIPKPSVFVREQQQPTASVLLTLHPGRELDRSQVNGIVHLVASSVPELALDNVSVIDQNGALLSRRRDGGDSGLDATQLSYVKQLEQATIQRINDILEPMVGRNNARVQVTADVDFNRVEAVAETYRPNQDPKVAALRTQQTSQSTTTSGAGPQGVPGALSNQPPAAGTAVLDAKVAATDGGRRPPPRRRARARTKPSSYEVDKKIEHTKGTIGGLRRLTAAVVVNHRRQTDADGKVTLTPLSPQEMEQITSLVREAMGFSKDRGDSLNVVNAAFSEPPKEVIPEVPLWKQSRHDRDGEGRRTLPRVRAGDRLSLLRRAAPDVAPGRGARVRAAAGAVARAAPHRTAPRPCSARARSPATIRKVVANVVKTWVGSNG